MDLGSFEVCSQTLRSFTENGHRCEQVAKALIVRSDPFGYRMIEDLLELFKSGDGVDGGFGREVAKQLGVIVEAEGEVLSKENHSVIRVSLFSVHLSRNETDIGGRGSQLLYKQRFFTFLLPKLVEAHKAQQTTSSGDSAVYLIALSSLLQHLPKQLTLTELPKVCLLLCLPLRYVRADLSSLHVAPTTIDHLT